MRKVIKLIIWAVLIWFAFDYNVWIGAYVAILGVVYMIGQVIDYQIAVMALVEGRPGIPKRIARLKRVRNLWGWRR